MRLVCRLHEAIGLLSAVTVLSEDIQFRVKHASFQAALMIQMYVYMNVCQKQFLYIMFVFTVVPCQKNRHPLISHASLFMRLL